MREWNLVIGHAKSVGYTIYLVVTIIVVNDLFESDHFFQNTTLFYSPLTTKLVFVSTECVGAYAGRIIPLRCRLTMKIYLNIYV